MEDTLKNGYGAEGWQQDQHLAHLQKDKVLKQLEKERDEKPKETPEQIQQHALMFPYS